MTPEKRARLAVLQDKEREVGHGSGPSDAEQDELDALRTELAREGQETADDKSTPFTDESRRPQLDGTDWNDMNKAMACHEVEEALKRGLEVLGDAALRAVVAKYLP